MTYRMFGIIGVLAMLAVAACQGEAVTAENWSPQLGSLIPVPDGPITLTAGEEAQTLARYSLSPDAETKSVTFLVQVPNTRERHQLEEDYSEWISDTYNWQQKRIRGRPQRSTMQNALSLCWLEDDGSPQMASDSGAVPDTMGRMTFDVGLSEDMVAKVVRLVCDVSSDAAGSTMSIRVQEATLGHIHSGAEPFYAVEEFSGGMDDNDRRVVLIQ